MVSPLRYVLDLPVRPPVADETFRGQFFSGVMELQVAETEGLHDRPIRIKASPLPVSDHHQKQIKDH